MKPMPRKTFIKSAISCLTFLSLMIGSYALPDARSSKDIAGIRPLIGKNDAVLLADPEGRIICSINIHKKRIPASTLKIFTALVALHHLGPDYRFRTVFYLDPASNLKIKGFGDPLLISEVLAEIAVPLSRKLSPFQLNDILLDDSFFDHPLVIPGVSTSSEPYDAPNGALCVNFNTINFKTNDQGQFVSAEKQTPLLPFALKAIRKKGLKRGRVVLSHDEDAVALYAGHLFKYFLVKEGTRFSGSVRKGLVDTYQDRLFHEYISTFPLTEVIAKFLEFSNNFSTNQLLISAGAKVYGPPGNLDKGVRVAQAYAREVLKTEAISISEGSGISRQNRITASDLNKALIRFMPYRHLMQKKGSEYFKTGTLKGIRTRAGYIEGSDNRCYSFVVLMNTPGKSTEPVMKALHRIAGAK